MTCHVEREFVRKRKKRRLLLLLFLSRSHRRRSYGKRICVREIFQDRDTRGEYHALVNEMRMTDHQSFYKYFHLSPERFDHLLSMVGPAITRTCTNCRQPIFSAGSLAITLRYLVTGDAMQTISFSYRVGQFTVCGIIDSTCNALWEALYPEYLKCPATKLEWKKVSEGFDKTWNLLHCLGSIDGKHIMIQAPANSGSSFYNYKGQFSIVLLAVCDSNYCFTLVDIGDTGRQSDGGVLKNSVFGKAMERDDAAFPLKTNMLRPFLGNYLPETKQICNYRLSRARRVIENTFGIMTTKFRIFRRAIIAAPEKATSITRAACSLHNYLRICEMYNPASSRPYCPLGYADREDIYGYVIPGDWRAADIAADALQSIHRIEGNRYSQSAAEVGDSVMNFLSSPEGSVSWQYDHIRSCGEQR